MEKKQEFEKAAKMVTTLKKRPDDETLLRLYALFKQATAGDVTGPRPGLLDLKGRKKFDAWTKLTGLPADQAMDGYIGVVQTLLKE